MSKNVTTLDEAQSQNAATAAEVAAPAPELIKHNADLTGVRKVLTIHASGEEGGSAAVFAGLNGVGYQIPRGKPWNVPEELVENFKNAEQTHYERDGNGKTVARMAPRFGYTVTDAPSAKAESAKK